MERGARRLISEEMKDVVPLDDESLRCLAEAYYAICDKQLGRIVMRDRIHARQTQLQVSEKSDSFPFYGLFFLLTVMACGYSPFPAILVLFPLHQSCSSM